MTISEEFGRQLRELRVAQGLTQQQLADQMYISRSAISFWESGKRMPDVSMVTRLATCLHVDIQELLDLTRQPDEPVIMLVDDERILLTGCLHTLSETLPTAQIYGFSTAAEALEFARGNHVDVAFLDIELGGSSGLDLAKKLTELDSTINIIFLTAYSEYMDEAWRQHASGYILKPLTPERIRQEMAVLRHTVRGLVY